MKMIIFLLADIDYLLEEVWQYLPIHTICQLLLVNKDMHTLCIKMNKTIPAQLKLKKNELIYQPRNRFGPRRPFPEEMKVKFFASMVKYFPNITSIDLMSSWIFYRTGLSIMFMYGRDDLRRTLKTLHVTMLNDESLMGISNLMNLTDLDISDSYSVTSKGLKNIATLTNLKRFKLTGNYIIRSPAFRHLSSLTNMESLHIEDTYVNDNILSYLEPMSKLTSLTLKNCPFFTDVAIVMLANTNANLTYLDIEDTHITDAGITFLADNLTSLQELNISYCGEIFEDGLSQLLRLPNLKSLDIRGARQRLAERDHLIPNQDAEDIIEKLKRKCDLMIF